MPVTFQKIASGTATATFVYQDDTITVRYYPNRFTKKAIAQTQADNDEDPLLVKLIKSWDIYEDAEMTTMFPISRIDEFGVLFKEALIEAIRTSMRPETTTP